MTLEEKIQKLGLSEERVNELKKIIVEDCGDCERIGLPTIEIINADDVVGTNRNWCEISWLEALDTRACKLTNFTRYNSDIFEELLLHPDTMTIYHEYPEVIKKDNKYYIDGNGANRLTMAKCLGNKKALVAVRDFCARVQ